MEVILNGKKYSSMTALCEEFNTSSAAVAYRIKTWGFSLEEALNWAPSQSARAHPDYRLWGGIKARCYQASHESYHLYGGRGVEMCEQWKNNFWAFVSDMGPRPSNRHSIDRIDPDKGYFKENCRWATHIEQNTNKKNNVPVGPYPAISVASRAIGVPQSAISLYLSQGVHVKDMRAKYEKNAKRNGVTPRPVSFFGEEHECKI